jgi:threonyl-tRNA synthetase
MQEEAPGMVFWHPKGWSVWQAVEQYMRGRLGGRLPGSAHAAGDGSFAVGEVRPLGQLPENMFVTESEKRDYAIKPMNCPGHVQIFNHGLRSYRDLPLRLPSSARAIATSRRARCTA